MAIERAPITPEFPTQAKSKNPHVEMSDPKFEGDVSFWL